MDFMETKLRELDGASIDLERLLADIGSGNVDIELAISYAMLSEFDDNKIITWALKKYDIGKTYELTTRDGSVVARFDFTEQLNSSIGNYLSAFETLEDLGLLLSDESKEFLKISKNSYVKILEQQIKKKTGQDVNIVDDYLIEEQGFERGKFEVKFNHMVIGNIPFDFLLQVTGQYLISPEIFGFGWGTVAFASVMKLEKKAKLNFAIPYAHSAIKDNEKALEVLETLQKYLI